jgi:uncharacterized protein YraI
VRIAYLFAMLAIVAIGCTGQVPASRETPNSALASPFVPLMTATQAPPTAVPTPTSTATALPTPYVPFTVTTWADNVLLRTNPGYLFPQVGMLRQGTSLQVLAKSPGGEWLLCQTSDHRAGWVFAQLVQSDRADFGSVPVIWPSSAQALEGRVKDQAGVPISGIQFSVIQGTGSRAPRNDAVTDASGMFYAFMPAEAGGQWLVSYTAVSCTSNVMDANCNCLAGRCGMPDPQSITVDLPTSQDAVLEFTLK